MRLEQLVLFGPEDDFRVHFGAQVTVLSGLHPEERTELIETLVDAMAGRLPNASVIYVDHAGRRVFADRTGATFAETGLAAPPLTSIVGHDPNLIEDLVTLTAEDLGLGVRPSPEAVEAERTAARAAVEQLEAERSEATEYLVRVDEWRHELEALDARIEQAPDDADRWTWMQLRSQLDGLRAELAALDQDDDEVGAGDGRLLEAVEDLRAAGEAWAEADAEAVELAARLGEIPAVSDADLDRVAATPERLPDGFDGAMAEWEEAAIRRRRRTATHEEAQADVAVPDDELVARLATLDQTRLWTAHDLLVARRADYDAELADLDDDADPEIEAEIEDAHLEVLRCQRAKDRRFLPGMLGSASHAVGALLAGDQLSIILGVALLVAAVAMAWWLLVLPRRTLALATRDEEMALGRANAGTWLGLHLRRIDDVMQPADRRGVDAAVDAYASAQLDWEELTGGTDPDQAEERREAIVAHALLIDPARRAQAIAETATDLQLARDEETGARARVFAQLDGYGLSEESAVDLEPAQVRKVLARRVDAGQYARDAKRLRYLQSTAASSATQLEHLLLGLGFDDGRLGTRLDRAIDAITAARARSAAASERRTANVIEDEIAALTDRVEAGRRLSWDLTPEPTEAPADPDELTARRGELSELLASRTGPDLVDAERRLSIARDRVRVLDAQLAELAGGQVSVHRRIVDRVSRTTWMSDHEESIPVVVDDALSALPPGDRNGVLDLLARLSPRTQIIILSNDPIVAGWARERSTDEEITLFEAAVSTDDSPITLY